MWWTSAARRNLLPSTIRLPGPRLIFFRPVPRVVVPAMELFTQLFGHLLAFVYHCFDRIVIHGYLTRPSRPEHVVYFLHEVIGAPAITKEILTDPTNRYQNWVEAFARNRRIPSEWAETGIIRADLGRRRRLRMMR